MKQTRQQPQHLQTPGKRRASVSVQVLFLAPLMVLAIVAAVQYTVWSVARQSVETAAIDGTRVAACRGSLNDVVAAVRQALAVQQLEGSRGCLLVIVERGGTSPQVFGNPGLGRNPPRCRLAPGEVRVTVCVRPGSQVPDWLGMCEGGVMQSTCLMSTH